MKWSTRVARVFGIDIKIHGTFYLILLLGAVQWGVPHGMPGAVFGVLLMSALFVCVVLHELGHSLVAKAFGLPVHEIVLLPIGGVAKMEKNPEKPVHELLISIAGPLVNVAIAAVLVISTGAIERFKSLDPHGLVDGQPMAPSGTTFLFWLIAANVTLAVFNLIPAFPLDGGRVLRSVLAMVIGFSRATRIAVSVGQVLAVALGLLGLFDGNFILAFIAVFIFLGAGQERNEEQARAILTTLRVGDAYNKYALTLSPGDTLSHVVGYLLTSYQPDFAVLQGSRLLGVVTRDDVLKTLASETQDVYVAGIMQREVLAVDGKQSLDEVRNMMQEKGTRIAAVYEGESFLGLISQEDMAEALVVSAFSKNQETRRRTQEA